MYSYDLGSNICKEFYHLNSILNADIKLIKLMLFFIVLVGGGRHQNERM